MTEVSIRTATKDDCGIILGFVRELAEYENLAHEIIATEEILTQTMFGAHAYAESLIAEINGKAVGFALFFHNFSTFIGRPGLYVEDVYVTPTYRHSGIGLKLFRALAKIALQRDCGRMEWAVLDWNQPAITFYEKIGAKPKPEWITQRLTRKEIQVLASSSLNP